MKKLGAGIAAAAVAVLVLVLLAHAPFVRAAALRYAVAVVQRDYGLTLEAARLDYNLATLRLALAGLRVSAEGSGEPFFEADLVSVTVPPGILLGNVAFREIGVTNGHVFVHTRADGSSNLPESQDAPGGEPPPLRIDRLQVPRLAVEIRNEQADFSFVSPALGLLLTPDEGTIAMARPADVRVGARALQITALSGQATFDGRALHLMATNIRTDLMSLTIDGTLLLIARESRMDLAATGDADIGRLAQWGLGDGDLPQGQVTFRVTAAGPFGEPEAELEVAATRLSWHELVATNFAGRARVNPGGAQVETLEFEAFAGRVTAAASVPFDPEGRASATATLTGVDAALATRATGAGGSVLPAATAAGRLGVEGIPSDSSSWSGMIRLDLAPGRNARGRLAVGGTLVLELSDGRWMLEGSPRFAGVLPTSVTASGQLEPRTVDGRVRLAETDIPSLLAALRAAGLADTQPDLVTGGKLDVELALTGTLTDPDVQAQAQITDLAGQQFAVNTVDAMLSGRAVSRRLDFSVTAPSAVVADQAVNDVRVSGTMNGSVVELGEAIASQPGTSGAITARGTYDINTSRYRLSLGGTGWQLIPTPEQPVAGRLDVEFEGGGIGAAPSGTGKVSLTDGMWQDITLGGVDASIELNGRSARLDARAPVFDATASGSVELDAPYAAALTANAGQLDLSRVLQGVETPTPVSGTAGLVLKFDGPLETWRTGTASLEVTSLNATAGSLPLTLVQPAHIRYERERAFVESFEASAGEVRLSASGDLDVFEPARASGGVLVTLTGDVAGVARAAEATGLADIPVDGGSGPVALLARVNGSVETPILTADLELGPGSIALRDLPSISGLVVRGHAGEGWLELREGAASFQDATVTVTGRAPLSWVMPSAGDAPGGAVIQARAANLTAAVLAPFIDASAAEQLEGSVDATLEATSAMPDLTSVTGELRLDRLDVRIADVPVTQRAPTRIVARDGFARIESWDWTGQGTSLNVRGQVRLDDRQAAILADGLVDLRMLTPFVRDAGLTTAGRLEPRLSITGALDAPRVDGDLTLTGGELRLTDPRVVATDLTLRSVITSTNARITALTGTVNGGSLTGAGGVEYSPDQGLNVELSTNITGMAMDFPEGLRSEVGADLALTLKVLPEPEGRLSGTITVARGSYREPLAVVAGLLTGMRAQRLAAGTTTAPSSPLLSSLALDVALVTDEDIIVNNNYGRFQLGGDLRLVGTAAAPSVTGRAELREGGQLFVGRNVYTINSGTIDFTNTATIEPVLNIQATTRAGGEEIEVSLTGPAESPTPTLSSPSNPELSEADRVALLLTGRPYDELAPGDAAFVGTQVLGNLSGEVLGFAGRAIGLDTIRLGGPETTTLRQDPIAVVSEVDPTNRLTFGKSIGGDVELTLSQSLRDGDAQTWIVDYLPKRGLELRLVSDDDDLLSFGFRHDVAFGGPRTEQVGRPPRPEPPRIAAVTVSGDLGLPEDRVRGVLRLGPGDRFDFASWQADRDRLEALYAGANYLTARITPQRSEAEGGLTLEYQIVAGPSTQIVATGLELDAALRRRLAAAWAQSAFDDFLRDEAAQIVRESLAARGYLQPMVMVALSGDEATRTLAITVDQGNRTTMTRVRVQGTDEAVAAAILATLEAQRLVERAASDPGAIERAATDYLRTQGYLRASATAGAPFYEEVIATVPLSVETGPAFTIAGIAYQGAARLAPEARLEALQLPEGSPYDVAAVEAARARLVTRYRQEAFPAASVAVKPDIPAEGTGVTVTFVVNEGPQQVLSEAVVSGTRAVEAAVVVRAVGLEPGAPVSSDELLRARTRVLDMGIFRRADIESEPLPETAGAAGPTVPLRLRVTVEEWPALRLRYGFQVAEQHAEESAEGTDLTPGLSADISRRTLFGKAIALGAAFEWQRRERVGRAFLSTPTLFGRQIGSAFIAERSRIDSSAVTLVTDRSTVRWEQRTRIVRSLGVSYAYSFERNHTFDTAPPIPGDVIPPFDITINIARLTANAAWDTRDDPVDTARGSFLTFSLENAPASLGSDIRFIRELAQAYHFRPWKRVVLASAARFGVVSPLGGQELITSERFFTGGARTVRGVSEDSLGPQDFFGDPEGGRLLLVFNQEARVPIYRWVRGVAFVDTGNVFETPGDANIRDLVGSIGFGLRLATPFALLRLDFAKATWNAPEGATSQWIFGIGQAF